MSIALFGASGRTGRLVLQTALRRGWPVRALVRSASKLPEATGLKAFEGDARDGAIVGQVVAGAGAVVCTLGMHDIGVPATDFSDSVKTIVGAMLRERVRRIVLVASAGVLDAPGGGYRNQQPDQPGWLKHVSAEHVRNVETLRDSGLDWTVMCPAMLVDDIPAGHGHSAFDDLPAAALGSGETGYADLARAICDLLADRKSFGRRVGILSLRPR